MNLTPEQIPQSHDPEGERMYHDTDGFYAERLDDGSVRLVKKNPPTPIERSHGAPGEVVMDHTIPVAEWASIVAAVSAGGETSATYQAALNLHSVPTSVPTRDPQEDAPCLTPSTARPSSAGASSARPPTTS